MTPPPPRAEQAERRNERCTTSAAAPIVDGIIGGYQAFRTIYATQAPDSTYQNFPISRGADIGIGLAMTALFVSSAIYGGINTSACRDYHHRIDEEDVRTEADEPVRPRQARPTPADRAAAPPAVPAQAPAASASPEPAAPEAAPAVAASPPAAPPAPAPPAVGSPPGAASAPVSPAPKSEAPKSQGAFPQP